MSRDPGNRGPNFYRRHKLSKAEADLLAGMVADYGLPAVATVAGMTLETMGNIVAGELLHLTTLKRARAMLERFSTPMAGAAE